MIKQIISKGEIKRQIKSVRGFSKGEIKRQIKSVGGFMTIKYSGIYGQNPNTHMRTFFFKC